MGGRQGGRAWAPPPQQRRNLAGLHLVSCIVLQLAAGTEAYARHPCPTGAGTRTKCGERGNCLHLQASVNQPHQALHLPVSRYEGDTCTVGLIRMVSISCGTLMCCGEAAGGRRDANACLESTPVLNCSGSTVGVLLHTHATPARTQRALSKHSVAEELHHTCSTVRLYASDK